MLLQKLVEWFGNIPKAPQHKKEIIFTLGFPPLRKIQQHVCKKITVSGGKKSMYYLK